MEWVLRSPQMHNTFGNLGFLHTEGYHINENCNAALELILHNILTEDRYLRSYRRSISFGQNIKKDLIPLLIHAKEDKTIELLIRILVNLTIPIECLLSVDIIAKSDFGRHTIFEINNLLASTKIAFTDHRATKVVIDFLKKNFDIELKCRLTDEQCTNICNSLLLLRNILHIPEDGNGDSPNHNGSNHTVQNQILWNIFSQSIDKVLIKLMTMPEACNWGVTMVQLIALLYKDQHVVTLHKLLNIWLEASLSESSEDNESNTSPPNRGSEDSSPMLTSDPTSDSSDTGGSGNSNGARNAVNAEWDPASNSGQSADQTFPTNKQTTNMGEQQQTQPNMADKPDKYIDDVSNSCGTISETSGGSQNKDKKPVKSETSDCGYGTQLETNQESISTSSNEEELPKQKPIHQKPHNPKQRPNTKVRSGITPQDRKRKKIVKRGKTNIINVQGLSHKTPTDDDISNVLKEFTVDFLLKGYNSLVQTLHNQILTNVQLEIDTSHFFWLVTYFLKFATQIELDLQHVCSVLSFDIVSYLTAQGVNLCEQFELSIKLDGSDLTPSIRRLHLVVTAIRELVQAIEVYKKITHSNKDDHDILVKLQVKICETEELRSLFVLLLRHYNPKYHSKQYLQDVVVTNHILLMFLDSVMKLPDHNCPTSMIDHMRQFATPKVMYQYGLLLEDYAVNGEFVNDCILTLMHHVGGELECGMTLFQPRILKAFTSIWKSEFEICDDWSDLIEYVVNTYMKKPHAIQSIANINLDTDSLGDDDDLISKLGVAASVVQNKMDVSDTELDTRGFGSNCSISSTERWTEDEISSLSWTYMQCSSLPDIVGEIINLLKEDGIVKSRDSVLNELYKQHIINEDEFDKLMKEERYRNANCNVNKQMRDNEIGDLCKELSEDGKENFLNWVQKVLLETCHAKLYSEKGNIKKDTVTPIADSKLLHFELFKKKSEDLPVMSSVSYHAILTRQSIPLVPWNCQQAAVCKDLKFLQLLHKLGFHMPVDTGKVFIRIPQFWTADLLYDVAGKISPIDTTKLKFSVDELSEIVSLKTKSFEELTKTADTNGINITEAPENFYQIQKQKHLATMVNYTPMPGSSFSSDGEFDSSNWLKVVQQSQEYKITLNLETVTETTIEQRDVVMQVPSEESDAISITMKEQRHMTSSSIMGMPIPGTSFMMPTVMSVKHETSQFTVPPPIDPDFSVCETASVASDLTRMYVSDEDDKSDIYAPPNVHSVLDVDEEQLSVDSDNAHSFGKRPRIQHSSPF